MAKARAIPPAALLLTLGIAVSGCGQIAPRAYVGPSPRAAAADAQPVDVTAPPAHPADPLAAGKAQHLLDSPVASSPRTPAQPAQQTSAGAKPLPVTLVPILMYHYIRTLPPNTPDKLGYGLSIAPPLFEQQLAYLAGAGYVSVTMAEVSDRIANPAAPLPPKPIVLSFDDGYADFYTAAWPLLQKYHFSATVYLVVDFLGRPGYMSWQQAQELKDAGVEIGAHTLDHVDLAKQQPAQAQRQINDSGTILRQRLGASVTTFAYPSGSFTAATVKLVGQDGFRSAVTTNFGDKHTAADLLTLTRVRVPGGISMPNFVKNLSY
ncbi:MAG: polysaccharide deacetylase family protein [Chloroflexi bacterium]|nr:polysaccharide deacetylase family protein [Chloroflexota bacterium]